MPGWNSFRRVVLSGALAVGALGLLGACAGPPPANPEMVAIVPGPDVPPGTKGPNGEPLCREVGGYEAYYKKTGKACFLGPDAFLDINYHDPGGNPI
ncbi:MAG: hypothetical protein ACTSUD_09180 [Alphaproteobacteria bacterium]